MTNWYVDRDSMKAAMSIPANATADHALLDAAIEGVSRLIDQHVKLPLYAHTGTRYYSADDSECLYLDTPLTSLTALRTDPGGDASYETTWSTGDYWLTGADRDFNARSASPPRPYWEIHRRQSGSNVFPTGVERGVEIVGTWGYFDQRRVTAAVVTSSPWDATATSLPVTGATALHPGNTLLVDTEQLFINDITASTSTLLVQRQVNGTTAAAHTSGTAIEVYEYPVVSEAAKFQVTMDMRAKDTVGGYPGEGGAARVPMGGLHPYVQRMLSMRVPSIH